MNRLIKITSIILIQSFLLMDLAWAGGSNLYRQKQNKSTLAPDVNISKGDFQQVFDFYASRSDRQLKEGQGSLVTFFNAQKREDAGVKERSVDVVKMIEQVLAWQSEDKEEKFPGSDNERDIFITQVVIPELDKLSRTASLRDRAAQLKYDNEPRSPGDILYATKNNAIFMIIAVKGNKIRVIRLTPEGRLTQMLRRSFGNNMYTRHSLALNFYWLPKAEIERIAKLELNPSALVVAPQVAIQPQTVSFEPELVGQAI